MVDRVNPIRRATQREIFRRAFQTLWKNDPNGPSASLVSDATFFVKKLDGFLDVKEKLIANGDLYQSSLIDKILDRDTYPDQLGWDLVGACEGLDRSLKRPIDNKSRQMPREWQYKLMDLLDQDDEEFLFGCDLLRLCARAPVGSQEHTELVDRIHKDRMRHTNAIQKAAEFAYNTVVSTWYGRSPGQRNAAKVMQPQAGLRIPVESHKGRKLSSNRQAAGRIPAGGNLHAPVSFDQKAPSHTMAAARRSARRAALPTGSADARCRSMPLALRAADVEEQGPAQRPGLLDLTSWAGGLATPSFSVTPSTNLRR
jgi:hypothetical protein